MAHRTLYPVYSHFLKENNNGAKYSKIFEKLMITQKELKKIYHFFDLHDFSI
jgi:hypothetical protein